MFEENRGKNSSKKYIFTWRLTRKTSCLQRRKVDVNKIVEEKTTMLSANLSISLYINWFQTNILRSFEKFRLSFVDNNGPSLKITVLMKHYN